MTELIGAFLVFADAWREADDAQGDLLEVDLRDEVALAMASARARRAGKRAIGASTALYLACGSSTVQMWWAVCALAGHELDRAELFRWRMTTRQLSEVAETSWHPHSRLAEVEAAFVQRRPGADHAYIRDRSAGERGSLVELISASGNPPGMPLWRVVRYGNVISHRLLALVGLAQPSAAAYARMARAWSAALDG